MKMKKDKLFVLKLSLVCLFVGLLVWAIVVNVNKEPTFKITEEVCENITYTHYFEQTDYSKEIKCYDSKENEIKDLICYDEGIASVNLTYESCESVEVEEIEIERIPENQEKCRESAMINVKDCPIGEPNSDECIYGVCHEFLIIEKRYLLIEWLDENCLAFMRIDGETGEEIFEDIKFPKKITEDFEITGTSKYKCGKYTVEVEQ